MIEKHYTKYGYDKHFLQKKKKLKRIRGNVLKSIRMYAVTIRK